MHLRLRLLSGVATVTRDAQSTFDRGATSLLGVLRGEVDASMPFECALDVVVSIDALGHPHPNFLPIMVPGEGRPQGQDVRELPKEDPELVERDIHLWPVFPWIAGGKGGLRKVDAEGCKLSAYVLAARPEVLELPCGVVGFPDVCEQQVLGADLAVAKTCGKYPRPYDSDAGQRGCIAARPGSLPRAGAGGPAPLLLHGSRRTRVAPSPRWSRPRPGGGSRAGTPLDR